VHVQDRQSSWAGDILQLAESDIDSIFRNDSDVSADMEVQACVRLNVSSLHSEELRICSVTNITAQRNLAPTIAFEGFGTFVSSGREVVLAARINHHIKSPNMSLSLDDIASFSYRWTMRRLTNSQTARSGADINLIDIPSSRSIALRIPKYMLEPQESYRISFEANMTKVYGMRRGLVSFADVLSTIARGVVAGINGLSNFQNIPADVGLNLDGSSACYDPEDAPNSTWIFQWSCINQTEAHQICSGARLTRNGAVYALPSERLAHSTILNLTLNFSVVSNGGTLRRSSLFHTTFHVIPKGSPSLFITGRSFIVSRGGTLSLTANFDGGNSTDTDSLTEYRWEMERNSSSPFIIDANTASIVLPGSQLVDAARPQQKEVAITAIAIQGSERARSTVTVRIIDVLEIGSIRISPLEGVAYTSEFKASASVIILDLDYAPTLTSFSFYSQNSSQSNPKVLCTFSLSQECTFSLPAGNHSIVVKVKDSIGGVSEAIFGPIQVHAAAFPVSDTQSAECVQASQAVSTLRKMTEGSFPSIRDDSLVTGDRPASVCRSLNLTLNVLNSLEEISGVLNLARMALEIIDSIPVDHTLLSQCVDYAGALGSNTAASGGSKGCSSDAPLSLLSSDLWDIVSNYVERLALVTDIAAGEESLMVAQVIRESVETQSFKDGVKNIVQVKHVLDAVDSITANAEPSELAADLGNTLADSYGAILMKSGSASNHPASLELTSCSIEDQLVSSMDSLLHKAGKTSPPQSNAGEIQFRTSSFNATAGSIFADEVSSSSASSGLRVSISPTTAKSSISRYERPTNILTLLQLSAELIAQCRQRQIQQQALANTINAVLASDVASVNFYKSSGARLLSRGSSDHGPRVNITIALRSEIATTDCGVRRVCSFWDASLRVWRQDGCAYNGTDLDGLHTCACNHLTEFAVLADRRSCSPEENEVKLGYWGLVGLLLVIALAAFVQLARLAQTGFKKKNVAWTHFFVLAVAITRAISVLMVSESRRVMRSLVNSIMYRYAG